MVALHPVRIHHFGINYIAIAFYAHIQSSIWSLYENWKLVAHQFYFYIAENSWIAICVEAFSILFVYQIIIKAISVILHHRKVSIVSIADLI